MYCQCNSKHSHPPMEFEASGPQGLIAAIDPRLKIVFVLVSLIILISSGNVAGALFFVALSLTLLVLTGIKAQVLLKRLAPALLTALLVFITQVFLYGTTPAFKFELAGFTVVAYQEGIRHGLLLMMRVVAGMSIMLLLIATTTVEQLILAASWFRLPHALIEIMTIAYRYIFVFIEETDRLQKAQKLRLGHIGWHRKMKSLGVLGGMTIIRAFEKSERLYQSMRSRGYRGQIVVDGSGAFPHRNRLHSVLAAIMLAVGAYLSLAG